MEIGIKYFNALTSLPEPLVLSRARNNDWSVEGFLIPGMTRLAVNLLGV